MDAAGDGHASGELQLSALFLDLILHFLPENGRLNQEKALYRGLTSHTTGFEVISHPPGAKSPSEAYLQVVTPDLEHYSESGPLGVTTSQSSLEGLAINTALLSAMDTFPTPEIVTGQSGTLCDGMPIDVGDLLRSLPTRANLKVLMVELQMEIKKETQVIGDKLVAIHGRVETGEATSKGSRDSYIQYRKPICWVSKPNS